MKPEKQKFPRSFWTANATELFERGAYYAMASFVVIYLGRLGFGEYWPSTLNGVLWTIVYFLPILSGTIADQIGFRKALLLAFVLIFGGYLFMSYPVLIAGHELAPKPLPGFAASIDTVIAVVAGILLIGVGGSFVKPCISGTIQKTSLGRATLGFAIFYMIINIGSLFGRAASFTVRTKFNNISLIFVVAAACAAIAFLIVMFLYRDPETELGGVVQAKPKRSVGEILFNMVRVLGNKRFLLFLLVSSGFNFLYSQVYNVLPLYLERVVENEPAVDLYTMANPIVIVLFQLVITSIFGKMKPIKSMVIGTIIISLAMVVNLVPVFMRTGARLEILDLLPIGSAMVVLTVAMIAFGELFTSARTYEYIGALAPKGQEGLFLGYANLPMAIGALVGGPVGALIFNQVMARGALRMPNGLLLLDPAWNAAGWIILASIGLVSATSMWLYNRWITGLDSRA